MVNSLNLRNSTAGGGTWGNAETQFFFSLTAEGVLEAVEASGVRCTGRCQVLNSFENRVYEVEIESEDGTLANVPTWAHRRIVKFYRPGRWSESQILEEHRFLLDLAEAEVPAVAPLPFPDGSTLKKNPVGIWYAIFPKVPGRAPDEFSDEQLLRVGRLLARVHQVGKRRPAVERLRLDAKTYAWENLDFLLQSNCIPSEYVDRYAAAAQVIGQWAKRVLEAVPSNQWQRVHGDCHLGNLLWDPRSSHYFFVDFDDSIVAPPIQDVWLLVSGRDEEAIRQRSVLLEGYEEMQPFDWTSLSLIEGLRALRYLHHTAWIARRWEDPAFPLAFPDFGTTRFWGEKTTDLEEQARWVSA